ncbi:hypothetical protein T492DRAFT_1057305, partial [Pavlovales sp. CCMP2436]
KVRLQLEWRYVARDVCAYVLSLTLLQWTALDGFVEPFELATLLFAYACYVTVCLLTGKIARRCCSTTRGPRSKRSQRRRRLRPTLALAPDLYPPPPNAAELSFSLSLANEGGKGRGLRQPLVRKVSLGEDTLSAVDFAEAEFARSRADAPHPDGLGIRPSRTHGSFAQLSHAIEAVAERPGPVGLIARGVSRASISIADALYRLDDDHDYDESDGMTDEGHFYPGYDPDFGLGQHVASGGALDGTPSRLLGGSVGPSLSFAGTPVRPLPSTCGSAHHLLGSGGGALVDSPLISFMSEWEARAAYAMQVRAARRAGYNLRHAAPPPDAYARNKGAHTLAHLPIYRETSQTAGWGSRVSAASSQHDEENVPASTTAAGSDMGRSESAMNFCPHSMPPSASVSRAPSSVCLASSPPLASSASETHAALLLALGPGTPSGKQQGRLKRLSWGKEGASPLPPPPPELPVAERLLEWPPPEAPLHHKLWCALNLPLSLLLFLLMPSPKAMARGWFPLTMLVCVLLLALVTLAMSWLCHYIAAATGIPDELLGSTVVAMGTSLPNVFAAVAVGRAGKADMAVCQAFGSNAFDVLVAFALPLAVKSFLLGGVPLTVEAPGLSRDVTVDLVFVALFLGLLFLYQGRMRPTFGIWALVMYLGWFVSNLAITYQQTVDKWAHSLAADVRHDFGEL